LLKIRATLDLSGDRCLFHCHLQTPSKFILWGTFLLSDMLIN
jgi:hypothetical protein